MLFAILYGVIMTLEGQSQKVDSTKLNLYAGLAGSGFFPVDTLGLNKWGNIRFGANLKEKITDDISFYGLLGYDLTADTSTRSSILFRGYFKTEWDEIYGIAIGYQHTVVSQIRPDPFSVDGQYEFTAESMIPGTAFGTSIWCWKIKAGVYSRENKGAEYQLVYSGDVFSTGLWLDRDKTGTNYWGTTAKVDYPRLYAMTTITRDYNNPESKYEEGFVVSVLPFKNIPYKIIYDYARNDRGVKTNFLGIQHEIAVKNVTNARIGAAYDFANRSFGFFYLVGLNYKR